MANQDWREAWKPDYACVVSKWHGWGGPGLLGWSKCHVHFNCQRFYRRISRVPLQKLPRQVFLSKSKAKRFTKYGWNTKASQKASASRPQLLWQNSRSYGQNTLLWVSKWVSLGERKEETAKSTRGGLSSHQQWVWLTQCDYVASPMQLHEQDSTWGLSARANSLLLDL